MFELINNEGTLLLRAKVHFVKHYNREPNDVNRCLLTHPRDYPFLATFYSCTSFNGRESVSLSKCSRNTAKSLVYHKTNKCKSYNWWRICSPKEYKDRINVVTGGYKTPKVHAPSITQEDFEDPFLLTYVTLYRPNNNRIRIYFFALNMGEARRLVYFSKDKGRMMVDFREIENKYYGKYNLEPEVAADEIEQMEDSEVERAIHELTHELTEAAKKKLAGRSYKLTEAEKKKLLDGTFIKSDCILAGGAYRLTCSACGGLTVSKVSAPRKCFQCGRHVSAGI